MLDALAKGSLFENALHGAYGSQYPSAHQLEEAFKPYAIQPPRRAGAGRLDRDEPADAGRRFFPRFGAAAGLNDFSHAQTAP